MVGYSKNLEKVFRVARYSKNLEKISRVVRNPKNLGNVFRVVGIPKFLGNMSSMDIILNLHCVCRNRHIARRIRCNIMHSIFRWRHSALFFKISGKMA